MIDIRKFFLYYLILLFVGTANVLIYFDIPLLRQIFGFLLIFIPGFILVDLIGLKSLNILKKFCLTWGLSIAFLLVLGLTLNFILLLAGFSKPLLFILPVLDICILILLGFHYYFRKNLSFFDSLSSNISTIKFSPIEKIILFYLICLITFAIFGSYEMNYSGNNSLLILYLILLFIGFLIISLFHKQLSSKIFPIFLFFTGLSIILLLPFRSTYLLGIDTHSEYYYFYQTLINQQWLIIDDGALNVCLSITTLPTIFFNLLNIPPVVLFKFLFPVLFSISPLIIFTVAEKYLPRPYSFFAGLFFCVQTIFLWATINARTVIALLFFYLIIFVLLDDQIPRKLKNLLAIIFFGSCLVSHYSTTYIAFFIFSGFALVMWSRKDLEFKNKNVINILTIFCFLLMLYFWYGQIIASGLSVGKGFFVNFSNQLEIFLSDISNEPVRSDTANTLLGKNIFNQPLAYQIKFSTNWFGFILIGLGFFAVILKNFENTSVKLKSMLITKRISSSFPNIYSLKTDILFIIFSILLISLLILSLTLPYISQGYGIERIYAITFPITSILFVFGAILVATFTGRVLYQLRIPSSINCGKISFIIMISFIFLSFSSFSGLSFHILGTPYSLLLETEGPEYNSMFIQEQELQFSSWYKNFYDKEVSIYGDRYSPLRFRSNTGLYLNREMRLLSDYSNNLVPNYIFIRYLGVTKNKILDNNGQLSEIKDYNSILIIKNIIYSNGGSALYFG